MHKALLCHHSPYFRGALNNTFIEGQNNAVELKDEDPECFQNIVAWMYRGTVPRFKHDGDLSHMNAIPLVNEVCHLYFLADFLRVEVLLVEVVEGLSNLFRCFADRQIIPLDSEIIISVCTNTTDASPLRALVMEELVYVWCDRAYKPDIKKFEAALNQVDGLAAELVTGMRRWHEKRKQAFLENVRTPNTLNESTGVSAHPDTGFFRRFLDHPRSRTRHQNPSAAVTPQNPRPAAAAPQVPVPALTAAPRPHRAPAPVGILRIYLPAIAAPAVQPPHNGAAHPAPRPATHHAHHAAIPAAHPSAWPATNAQAPTVGPAANPRPRRRSPRLAAQPCHQCGRVHGHASSSGQASGGASAARNQR